MLKVSRLLMPFGPEDICQESSTPIYSKQFYHVLTEAIPEWSQLFQDGENLRNIQLFRAFQITSFVFVILSTQ